ncbi:MAG TPA: hypothetical protein VJS64_11170 [Pyrinomonadaceae bacterium]|nr:hypothetical protein [Pyrinomonadaceae bacterium]
MKNPGQRLAVSALILLAMAVAGFGQSTDRPQNEIEVFATFSIPGGDTSFSTTGSTGTVIDFSRDFDFQSEWGFELRYTRRSKNGKHKLVADYADTRWNRDTVLTRSFTFLGETYLANLAASGDLKLQYGRGMYAYRWGNDKVRIGPMVDMGVIKTSLELTGTTNSGTRTREGSITKFAATVGYDLDYDPHPKVNIFNNLGAIAFQGDHLFHVEGGVRVYVSKQFGVTGGYKAQRYKLVDGDNFFRVRSHGPFFGGIFRF